MDQIFFSPSNGVPSESKLATYMNRGQNVTSPLHQYGGLGSSSSNLNNISNNNGIGGMLRFNLDSPLTIRKAQVTPQSPEFIPAAARLNSSPSNFQWPSGGQNGGSGGGGSLLHGSNGTTTNNHNSSNNNNNGHIVKPNFVKGLSIGSGGGGGGGGSSASNSSTSSSAASRSRFNNRNLSPEDLTDSPQSSPPTNTAQMLQENVGGTTYFYPAPHQSQGGDGGLNGVGESLVGAPEQLYQMPVHMYPGPAAHVLDAQPKSQLFNAFFMGEELRGDVQARNAIANGMEAAPEFLELPHEVDNYHGLTPIEEMPVSMKMPVVATMYKATHSGTGVKYCLRRIQVKTISTKCMSIIEQWKKLQHSNIVQLREVFTTKACGDNSLILVYDYHAGSQTLLAKYFTANSDHLNSGNGHGSGYADPFGGEARPFSHKSSMARTMGNGPMLPENEIWSLIMQITAGLKAIHQAGLACRTLDPTKLIMTGKRIRFSCLGVSDIVSFDPNQTNQLAVTNHFQQEDMTSLGKLVLALACRSLHAVHRDQMQSSLDHVSRHYSNDLNNLIFYLFTNNVRSVSDLMPMIGARFYTQLDALQSQCDIYQDELAKEMENGRLYRLLVKLNFINERPEFNLDPSWSETGDRYMLKLFRDYLFHSVADDGRPWLDHAHIVQCLNRLDAGTLEKVQLMSRDEQSVLLVTYAELKHCLEQSFTELVAAS